MRSLILKRLLFVLAIGCVLLAILVGAVMMIFTTWVTSAERAIAKNSSCFDLTDDACVSDGATIRYIEAETDFECLWTSGVNQML